MGSTEFTEASSAMELQTLNRRNMVIHGHCLRETKHIKNRNEHNEQVEGQRMSHRFVQEGDRIQGQVRRPHGRQTGNPFI